MTGAKPWGVPYTPYRDPRETFHYGFTYDPCAACAACEGKACGNAACPKLMTSWNSGGVALAAQTYGTEH